MPCYCPHKGFRRSGGGFTPSPRESATRAPISVPCGQCIGCRLDRVRDWSIRCVHEAKLHDASSFLTLTYSDEFLPDGGTLVPLDLQLFMKRLRKRFEPQRLRFYACGEYGDENSRPHYHVLLFGMRFPDLVPNSRSKTGFVLYESALLDALWAKGRAIIGEVTRESAAYTARYCLKKVTGSAADEHYAGRHPEFARMSTKPGIGYGWLQRYETDAFPSAYVVVNGQKYPVPRYYQGKLRDRYEFASSDRDSLLVRDDLHATRAVIKKLAGTDERKANSTPQRLVERHDVAAYKQGKIART